jgi:hypothetical protein
MNFTSELHKVSSGWKKRRRITYAEDVASMVDIKKSNKISATKSERKIQFVTYN